MAEFDRGQFFFDPKATNFQGQKGKYFIGLIDANEADDMIVCFVINSEKNHQSYSQGCNKDQQKFLLIPNQFSFLTNHSVIMLSIPCRYTLEEICESHIDILKDVADDNLCRQIKNCIDMDLIEPLFLSPIKDCYKDNSKAKT